MARAALNAAGLRDRARVEVGDYRSLQLPDAAGPTLFIGNPPYVRHHAIAPQWKRWLTATASASGYTASQLAGMHVYFFLATLSHAKAGDLGCFVTAAEWMDVNYGSLLRQMLTGGLGGESIHVIDASAMPFADAATTAAVTCFEVGRRVESIRPHLVENADQLGDLSAGHDVSRERLIEAPRWSPLMRGVVRMPEGHVELGEFARVHRGAVTGANGIWVTRRDDRRVPESVLRPCVTKARELFAVGGALTDSSALRMVIDLPADLDVLDPDERRHVERFLQRPEVREARNGYVASNRRAWWSVGLREPAPILATYMARRPPAFVRNLAEARHINIAHGIYPREPLSGRAIANLADHLRVTVTLGQGRTYAGGLTKFEPREMERLPVPVPAILDRDDFSSCVG
jgi:hypothetical protein